MFPEKELRQVMKENRNETFTLAVVINFQRNESEKYCNGEMKEKSN
jgi:hypothetical protein